MQGRDPDHDGGAPDEGPPETGYASRRDSRSSEPPDQHGRSGGFPVPPDPYRTSEGDAADSADDHGSGSPAEPHAQGPSGPPQPTGEPGTGADENASGEPPTSEWSTDSLRLAIGDPPGPTQGPAAPPPPQPPAGPYPQAPGPGGPQGGPGGPQGGPPPRWPSPGGPGGPQGGQPPPTWPPPYGPGGPYGGPPAGPPNGPPPAPYDSAGFYPQQPTGQRPIALIASLAVAAVVLLGGGAIAYATLLGGGGGPQPGPPSPPPSPPPTTAEQPTPSPSFDPEQIRNTDVDPKPLTVAEAFPDQSLTIGNLTFERVATDVARDCTEASQAQLDPALRQANCLRVVRATFVSQNGEYAVTAGVAVLPTTAEAQELGEAMLPENNVWFAGLPGPGAEQIDSSGGYSAKNVAGHYVMFAFSVTPGSTTPPEDSRDELKALGQVMVEYATRPIAARALVTPSPTS